MFLALGRGDVMVAPRHPVRFSLGEIVATPGALQLLKHAGISPIWFITRHASGDWGCMCRDDKALNDDAVLEGDRIHSAYEVGKGKIWIITECDRSVTTLLLPDEY
jgi:hypothetical protein